MLAQYHVVLEVDPKFKYGPEALNGIYVRSSTGQQVARMADPSVVQIEFNFRSRDRLDRLALYKNARQIFAIVSTISIPISAPMIMEASVDPQPWGPDWMPITPERGPFCMPKLR